MTKNEQRQKHAYLMAWLKKNQLFKAKDETWVKCYSEDETRNQLNTLFQASLLKDFEDSVYHIDEEN